MAIDLTNPREVTYQVLWATPMLELWLVYETLIVELPEINQREIEEELEYIFVSGYTQSVVAAIKHHASVPENWDTARHLVGEHPSIKAMMAKNRKELRAWLTKVSNLLSLNYTPHPKIRAAKKNKKKSKA